MRKADVATRLARLRPRSQGFTLIEVMAIMVVVLILAATAVPQFATNESEAKTIVLRFNLNTIRCQIETYKNHHGGMPPRLSLFSEQMTQPTNRQGHIKGKNLTLGPYFEGQIPCNPFNDSNMLTSVAKPGKTPKFWVPGRAGWQYDESTGDIYPNNPEFYPSSR